MTGSENSDNAEEEVLACMSDTVCGQQENKNKKKECEIGKETWLADSGATCHLTNDIANIKNQKTVRVAVRVSSGEVVYGTINGDVDLVLSSRKKLRLYDVLYVPKLHRKFNFYEQINYERRKVDGR